MIRGSSYVIDGALRTCTSFLTNVEGFAIRFADIEGRLPSFQGFGVSLNSSRKAFTVHGSGPVHTAQRIGNRAGGGSDQGAQVGNIVCIMCCVLL